MPQKAETGIFTADTINPPMQEITDTDRWMRGINTALSNPAVQQVLIAAAGYLMQKANPPKPAGPTNKLTGDGDSQMLFEGSP